MLSSKSSSVIMRSFLRIFFIHQLLFFSVLNFFALCSWAEPPFNNPNLEHKELTVKEANTFFADITNRIRQQYVEPVRNDKLIEDALNGVLNGLDPHSTYFNPKQFTDMKKHIDGRYGGLGLEVIMEEGMMRVVSAIPDTPAAKAGIQTGDTLLAIDDISLLGLSSWEIVEKLKGEPHTSLKLRFLRHKTDQIEVKLTRELINIKAVDWRVEGNIGYIQLRTFNKETTLELKKAILDIQEKLKEKLRGFILDLRNNPGGLFDQAITVSDLFLSKGDIVSIRGRDHQKLGRFEATPGDATYGLPLLVLINGGSASSSEIVAGALQDHRRALVVGTPSFGKGSVQNVWPLTNGGAIKLTTAFYETPAGHVIQKRGIKPDVVVQQLIDAKSVEEKGRFKESSFKTAIENYQTPQLLENSLDPKNLDKVMPTLEKSSSQNSLNKQEKASFFDKNDAFVILKDYQLEQALAILQALTVMDKGKQKTHG